MPTASRRRAGEPSGSSGGWRDGASPAAPRPRGTAGGARDPRRLRVPTPGAEGHPLRILLLLPEYPPHAGGGLLAYYRALAPALARRGHAVRVLVAAPFGPDFEGYDRDGVEVRCLPLEATRGLHRAFDRYAPLPDVRQLLACAWAAHGAPEARGPFDVVETTDWGLLAAPWAVDGTRPPLVVTLHGSAGQVHLQEARPGTELQGGVLRLLEAASHRAADERHTYGRANAEEMGANLGAEVRYLAPPWEPDVPAAPAPPPSVPPHDGVVVGRIQAWKGPDVLCEALRRMGSAAPTLVWVGRDVPHDAVRGTSDRLAERYPDVWGRRVLPIGPRPRAETAALQARAGFGVVPSTWDVFNYAGAETMAAGTPLVTSSAAGVADLVEDGSSGFVFPSGDAEALAERLARVRRLPPDARSEMGRRGREAIRQATHPDRVAAAKEERYRALASSRRAAGPLSAWDAEALRPAAALADPQAFLGATALRDLLRHARSRARRRILGR